ncbi:AAA family ATPase [Aquabacterium sp. A7-Y]|uniref:AAA family ATPase n=1 Tax=Aquabacterium sp. A7-Y TaxID=1349605 RepID=UPI00223CD314|nr:AAA family ATPase [Aquabacterium sp. A7-Y]MCW7541390.1 AAA family ATPase [Aquabacterium sp. A7-Y]
MTDAFSIFPRPGLARHYLDRLLTSPNRALSVFGPRQVGKTTLLQHDLVALAQREGIATLYVDFMASPNALELLNARLAQLVHEARMALPKRHVKSAKAAGFAIDLEPAPADPVSGDPGVQLQNAFSALTRLRPGVRLLLMLDEAQELVRQQDGERTMKAIRALFNTFQGQLLLLITGSSREGLLRLFGDRHRASFGLADHEDFQRLGQDFVEAKAAAFNKQRRQPIDIETLYTAFLAMEQRPADFMAYLSFLAINEVRDVVGSVQVFLRTRYPIEAVRDRFQRFTPLQRTVLTLLAAGPCQIASKETLDRVARELGVSVTAGGIRHALTSLPPDVVANPARGHYEIVDAQLLAWLREPGRE